MALVSRPVRRQCLAAAVGDTGPWVAWWPREQAEWCSHLRQVFGVLAKMAHPLRRPFSRNIFKGKCSKVVSKMLPPDFPIPASLGQGIALADVPWTGIFARETSVLNSCSGPRFISDKGPTPQVGSKVLLNWKPWVSEPIISSDSSGYTEQHRCVKFSDNIRVLLWTACHCSVPTGVSSESQLKPSVAAGVLPYNEIIPSTLKIAQSR